MPASISPVTSLTADYDAIERAIRETSRGRWFLSCYLERNRSAETKMLLGAIGKLEAAIRDNGQIADETRAYESLASIYESIGQARSDIAHLLAIGQDAAPLSLRRFNFGAIPAAIAEETQAICEAAASIHSAAYALQAAGVFQGVARQIIERAEAIEQACIVQDAAAGRARRLASLVSEIEAELMSMFEDDHEAATLDSLSHEIEIGDFNTQQDHLLGRRIPEELVEEISAALGDDFDEHEFSGT